MEVKEGSDLNRIIGIGYLVNDDGSREIYTKSYLDYHRLVVDAFSLFPIHKHFGLTIKDAMSLPVNEWYAVRDAAIQLKEKDDKSSESESMQLLREMLQSQKPSDE